jgi:hypothetical protein
MYRGSTQSKGKNPKSRKFYPGGPKLGLENAMFIYWHQWAIRETYEISSSHGGEYHP